MGHRESLTKIERTFCEEYFKHGDRVKAMIAAQHPTPRPSQLSRTWLKRPIIRTELARLKTVHERVQEKRMAHTDRTRSAALEKAWRIVEGMAEDDPAQARVALQALDTLAKAEGWLAPERHIHEMRASLQGEIAVAVYNAALELFGEDGARALCAKLGSDAPVKEIPAEFVPEGGENGTV